jgi:hypothetical protein
MIFERVHFHNAGLPEVKEQGNRVANYLETAIQEQQAIGWRGGTDGGWPLLIQYRQSSIKKMSWGEFPQLSCFCSIDCNDILSLQNG